MISVIIPAYNEEKTLPDTLRALFQQPGVFEVIVVDGGSSDGTRPLARDHAGVRLLEAPKGRASQMNAGARAARGEWLLFLHADTLLPENALSRLNQWEADPHYQAGGFTHRFSGDDWRLRLVSLLDNFRCRRTRIIFGDQALFVRRVLFQNLNGFPVQPILEDVAFCQKLVQAVTPVILEDCVITDSRKFVQTGIWRSLYRCMAILTRIELGLPIARSYPFFKEIR